MFWLNLVKTVQEGIKVVFVLFKIIQGTLGRHLNKRESRLLVLSVPIRRIERLKFMILLYAR